MLLFWHILNVFVIVHYCSSDQSCIHSCQFDYDIRTVFTLPLTCRIVKQARCSVLLRFTPGKQFVNIDFSSSSIKLEKSQIYETDNIAHSIIGFEEDSFIEQTIEYSCSTGDLCDVDYVQRTAIPLYSHKQCDAFQKTLIQHLHPASSSSKRECFISEREIGACTAPCDLFHSNSNSIVRSCDGRVDLGFQTVIGRSTLANKVEYHARWFSYACTSELCNGPVMEHELAKLIDKDHGKCLIVFNDTIETSTTALSTSTSTTAVPYNHTSTFATSWFVMIFVVMLFFV
jgi:hypothetical protein